MKTLKTLDEILAQFFTRLENLYMQSDFKETNINVAYDEARVAILLLVPDKRPVLPEDKNRLGIAMLEKDGWNAAIDATIKAFNRGDK